MLKKGRRYINGLWLSMTKLTEGTNKRISFYVWIFLAFIIGLLLRLYQLSHQVVGGDEWWAIFVALRHPFSYIFTHFHQTDNCIPLTAFYKLLMVTIGLNEWGLRFPQLLTGGISIIIFPIMIRRIFKDTPVIVFAFLLAIFPLFVFYSRFTRPYIIVVFLTFISTFSFYYWIVEKKRLYVSLYMVTAVLATYFNLFAFFICVAPLIYFFFMKLIPGKYVLFSKDIRLPSIPSLLFIALLLAIGLSILIAPASYSLNVILSKVGRQVDNYHYMLLFLGLLTGTKNYIMAAIILSLMAGGFYSIFRHDRLLGGYLLFLVLFQFMAIVIISPQGIRYPLVIARYFIGAIPLCLIATSLSLAKLSSLLTEKTGKRYLQYIFIGLAVLALFLSGPLIGIYDHTNSFTNHNLYQEHYSTKRLVWKRIEKLHEHAISPFYVTLQKEKNKHIIIETPFIPLWDANVYVIYQEVHGNIVKMGYSFNARGLITFKNVIAMYNKRKIRKTGADFVVVHKNILEELRNHREKPPHRSPYVWQRYNREAKNMVQRMHVFFGEPVFEDRWITVFLIQ